MFYYLLFAELYFKNLAMQYFNENDLLKSDKGVTC